MTTQSIIRSDAIDFFRAQPADSIDLVFGSPPYCDARTYGINAVYQCQEWVSWMLRVTEAALPTCKGLIAWVVAGVQRECNYWPAPEGLIWEWYKLGHYQWCPTVWWKVDTNDGGTGIPGSGGKQGLRKDWEYVLMFRRDKQLAWADNVAMGHEPVCDQKGGEMSNRRTDGTRVNLNGDDPWGKNGRGNGCGGRRQNGSKMVGTNKKCVNRGADGKRESNKSMQLMDATAGHDKDGVTGRADGRPMPKIANPGNVLPLIVKARVGGGHIGSKLAHEGEAPFPEKLAEFFVLSFCPPDGVVSDCFSGSGTTAAMAKKHGRNFVGCDLRQSQVDLGLKRLAQETQLLFS